MSVSIYALGCITYVGWALAIGVIILTEVFDHEIRSLMIGLLMDGMTFGVFLR